MPYIDTVGDVVRATAAVITGSSQLQEWGIHYACAVSGGADSRNGICGVWDAAFAANLLSHLDPTSRYYGTSVSLVKTIAPFQPVTTTPNTNGTSASTTLPTQVRSLVSLKTGMAGRHYRGRVYLPTPTILELSVLGHPTGAYLTAVLNYITPLITPIAVSGSTWTPCIYHRQPTGAISRTFTPITSGVVSDLWATQRRSGDYGRLNVAPW